MDRGWQLSADICLALTGERPKAGDRPEVFEPMLERALKVAQGLKEYAAVIAAKRDDEKIVAV